ncbi:hypothetical protein ETH_00043625 [Eimeria tenella]|uniref:Uncharacterized protein n=1 Tax=Eimeria tenella TaxID=5802 RepID=U6L876_EIMTE|nr:hypothetical protein ETH_00043625 [Eimeria tenella]CDJ44774.1 hypothetical protein ETH_00043625 [Eimeria tenella]|eukprot:XP_013235522.1 hypothetical protein ETH_00043625 [Eimeria tenella]
MQVLKKLTEAEKKEASVALALVLGDEGPPGGPPEQPEAALQQSLGAPHRPLRVYLKGRGSAQALLFRGGLQTPPADVQQENAGKPQQQQRSSSSAAAAAQQQQREVSGQLGAPAVWGVDAAKLRVYVHCAATLGALRMVEINTEVEGPAWVCLGNGLFSGAPESVESISFPCGGASEQLQMLHKLIPTDAAAAPRAAASAAAAAGKITLAMRL